MHRWRCVVAAASLTACQRMAGPPCPADAAPIDVSKHADGKTTTAYFRSVSSDASSSFLLQRAAADLVQYGEPPLPTLAGDSEAYRMLTTGPLGSVVVLDPAGGRRIERTATRQFCEDRDFGVTTRRSTRPIDAGEWAALSSCMTRELWGHDTPDDNPGVIVEGYTVACGPGGHEASCVTSELPTIVIEGVRDGKHLIRAFDSWDPRGRHAGLVGCFGPRSPT